LVHHTCNDLAQGGQLVGLDHLLQAGVRLLENALLLREVLPHPHDPADRPLGAVDEAAELGKPAVRPVSGTDPELAPAHPFHAAALVAAAHNGASSGMDVVDE